jgi:hypothetical protein
MVESLLTLQRVWISALGCSYDLIAASMRPAVMCPCGVMTFQNLLSRLAEFELRWKLGNIFEPFRSSPAIIRITYGEPHDGL